jgi:ABC-2 type transport system ATP-binding protein
MAIITTQNLSKSYRVAIKQAGLRGTWQHFWRRQYQDIPAVQDISFTIEAGEVVGFLGANGAGKTTTLKMLVGLVQPSSGLVRVAGHDPFLRSAEFLRKITLVMGQKQQLIWDLPALESLRINAAVYDVPDRLFQQRLKELSEMLNLQDKLTQPVRKLSLGERMKAELLASLIHRPDILFLDEPTLGLDVNAQSSVREFLKEYNRQYGATILLTSHYMTDITALCDRILLIHGGRLIYDGQLTDLLAQCAPLRQIKVELSQPFCPDQFSSQFAQLIETDGCSLRFAVRQAELTKAVAEILAHLPVVDLTVSDPPIEETIANLFRAGGVKG